MAIIGNLYKVNKLLADRSLTVVFDYLKLAANQESDVYNRIFSNPVGTFNKINLTKDIFALEQVYYTKDRSKCFVESHKKYIDFQLHLSGVEQMETIDVDHLMIKDPYDPEKDLITYEMVDQTSKIVMTKNNLAIYFPDDAHVGLPVFNGKTELIYKTVVKFPVELFNRS